MMASIPLWKELERELNFDLEWRQGGCLYVATHDEDWTSFQQWTEVARQYGLDTRTLERRQMDAVVTGLQGPALGGLYTPSDGQAEPRRVAAAFAARAAEAGALFFEGCGVVGVERVLYPRDPHPQPNASHAPRALKKLRALFPALRDAQVRLQRFFDGTMKRPRSML
ncbi:glycine/D-amino acid oxidase-like deaminating enzyme [Paraburkholderia sp. MM5384-R2]|nr:glycine/D-amino acid oxidase-like deaminating enzyme [Paraburkholderia sp. MM5384-R2]